MFYKFASGLQETSYEQKDKKEVRYGVCTSYELMDYIEQFHFSINTYQEFINSSKTIHKMDSYYGYAFGIFHVLHAKHERLDKIKVGMYITKNLVLVVCDDEEILKLLFDVVDKMNGHSFNLEHIVSSIVNGIIAGNLAMIEHMENCLADIDEDVINNKTDGFNQKTHTIRNQLLYLTHYYEQLSDVCEELLQDENSFFNNNEIHHLRILSDRIIRLHGNVHLLKEYMLQIRETCQSQMDLNLNRIMYIFTIVTVIFLPLTLIVGWYGMNFTHMPELSWQYGYVSVIIISIVIVVACLWFFKKKKLFK